MPAASDDFIYEIEKDFSFEAAHYFSHEDARDIFKRIHGHSFSGRVTLQGSAQKDKGWIRDLSKIDAIIKDTTAALDHALLNDIDGLSQPSLELIARWVFERLAPKLPGLTCVEIGRPSCGERARARRT